MTDAYGDKNLYSKAVKKFIRPSTKRKQIVINAVSF